MLKFTIFSEGRLLKTSVFDEPVVTIGRLPENTIALEGNGISRRHLRIEEDRDGSYLLTDLHSLNGTVVNGATMHTCTLHSGDVIVVANYSIIYEELAVGRTTLPVQQAPGQGNGADAGQSFETISAVPEKPVPGVPVLVQSPENAAHKLERQFMTIGSAETDDIRISGFMIGHQQAFIDQESDGWHISTNKIIGKLKVNGRQVKSALLQDNDRIEIGSAIFHFVDAG